MSDHPTDDLPADPDLDDVPPELLELDGQQVTVTEVDGTVTTSVLTVVPGLWGHARRYLEGFYDNPDGAV